ncbi:hypothetical protein P5673_001855 [Acropora cervicornis]|uniref:Uncharacterized protein n=1 Tax=Acropora cervicornis TaxID=6130 RepID=A0AAD9VGB6_ACRCE|nr:hypothetical protein P5673_001855 [Acropora cervicornis]
MSTKNTSAPEPTAESTMFPKIMTDQEVFLTYGVVLFVLAVFCIILLILVNNIIKDEAMSMKVQQALPLSNDVTTSLIERLRVLCMFYE